MIITALLIVTLVSGCNTFFSVLALKDIIHRNIIKNYPLFKSARLELMVALFEFLALASAVYLIYTFCNTAGMLLEFCN